MKKLILGLFLFVGNQCFAGDLNQKIVDHWLLLHGFSIGIRDCFSKESTSCNVDHKPATLEEKKRAGLVVLEGKRDIRIYNNVIKGKAKKTKEERKEKKEIHQDSAYLQAEIERNKCLLEAKVIIMSEKSHKLREIKVCNTLNKINAIGDKIAKKSLRDDNGFAEAIIPGAKGNYTNITQIITGLGQQLSNGERMPQQFRGRTLPHCKRSKVEFIDPFADDIIGYMTDMFKNRGLVVNSFINGLDPREFWFHAVGGREGILSTAIKTSYVGYLSRRLVKKLEDFKMTYYNTVTNSKGSIYSFEYNNGFDPSRAVLVNGSSQFCNVKIIIDRLNKQYENKQDKINKKKK